MRGKTFLKIGAAGASLLVGVKCTAITTNDEWGDVEYAVKKYLSPQKPKDKTKVVVLGSGWGALSFIQKMDVDNVDLTVISPRSFFFYTPLLAGVSTGTVSHNSIIEPIRWHTSRFGSKQYVQAECTGVDFANKKVSCKGHEGVNISVDYDHIVIAVGAEPATFGIPGVKKHATFMKEVEDSLVVERKLLENLESANNLLIAGADEAEINKYLHWVVIGGGPTGVELAAELADFLHADVATYFPLLKDRVKITLIEATDKILSTFDPHISVYAKKALVSEGTEVRCNAMVTGITDKNVLFTEKQTIAGNKSSQNVTIDYGILVWAGGIASRPITQHIATSIGNAQNSRRGLLVNEKFGVKGVKDGSAWAIGDCAVSGCAPTAQAAYQQGKYLGAMLRDTHFNETSIGEYPLFRYVNRGSLAYVGASKGVAELKSHLWDNIRPKGSVEEMTMEGKGAFALWRSLYFSKLLSHRNKAQVAFDWIKTGLFGRDISSPYVLPEERTDSALSKKAEK